MFFGNDEFDEKQLKTLFPSERRLHQVHGKLVIPSSLEIQQADGHYTSKTNQALVIKTADCMPVFATDGETIWGIHIGWRSLALKILSQAFSKHLSPQDLKLFVGPHIHQQAFQLDEASAKKLLSPHGLTIKSALRSEIAKVSTTQRGHFHIDLYKILKLEAKALGINNMHSSLVDTYSSPFHYSHRRNRWRVGTNYSIIIKSKKS